MRPPNEAPGRAGRQPQALELARQQLAQDPAEPNAELLRDIYLRLIRYLVERSASADVSRWLPEAERIDGPAAWWESLALLSARAGDPAKARQLLEKAPGSNVWPRIHGHVADRAFKDRQQGRSLLPEELRPGFDAIATAFAQYERGEDDAARQTLQAIGLQSPFLDWKLLIRGLIAYAGQDDARALDNWQRLDAERLPARLAAPFRFLIDLDYRNHLSAEQATAIAARADRVGHPMLASLRDLQRALASPEGLSRALKQVQPLLAMLRVNFPHLVPKLASCLYWLIVQGGLPDDLKHYSRLFGAPADDKRFSRLKALVMERDSNLAEAHRYWQDYLKEIECSPERWSDEQGRRARAMILVRMGENAAASLVEEDEPSDFNEIMDLLNGRAPRKPKQAPLVPSAEACYHEAAKLAPDWPEPAGLLMGWLRDEDRWAEAEAVGRQALERHPEHHDLLIELAQIQQAQGKLSEALASLQRALRGNPLDRQLRMGVGVLDIQHGRALAEDKQFDAARAAFREALDLMPDELGAVARAALAACEFKAGNPENGKRLIAELPETLANAYTLFVELTRAKAARPLIKPHQTRFETALADGSTFGDLLSIALAISFYRHELPPYRGLGTHEKKLLARLQAFVDSLPAEDVLEKLGWLAHAQRYLKILKAVGEQGCQRFGRSPCFAFFLAEQAILQRPKTFRMVDVGRHFTKVLKLSEGRNDERSHSMREAIELRRQEHPDLEYWLNPERVRFPW
jgi:tetratricopeptide (TPR) repeat protein